MKKKVLLSSIMTIALCLSLIAGSTFALFTSTSTQDIAINSGKVQMTANIEGLKLYSVQGNPDVADEDAVIDEKGNKYEYIEQTNGEFANGGTAAFDATEAKLTMERVTPGDKVEMTLTGANASNVAIQYRYSIKCLNGQTLMAGLNVYIAEGTNQLVKYESLNSYTTAWRDLAAETAMTDVALVIELPVTAGNEYQDLDAEIEITVEAVQGNAVTTNDDVLVTYIEKAATATDVERLLTNDAVDYIYLAEDLEDAIDLGGNLTDKTIDANGNNAIFNIAADANLENVVIKNIVDNDNASAINVAAGAKGVLTIEASELGGGENRPVNGASNPDLALTLKDCEISDYNYAAYFYALAELNLDGCTFNGSAANSWGVLVNGDIKGDFAVTNCKFINCNDGIVKAGVGGTNLDGTVGGVFTFTGNVLEGCAGHDGVDIKMFGIKYVIAPVIDNNTFDGADWDALETGYNSYGIIAK